MTETRALLLTDVVDSTKLSERLGDAAMAQLWAAHDRAARDLLPVHRGREIDKTDGMLLLFDRAADAVAYALLKAGPHLKVLASSRELLDVPGEQSFPVPPLPLRNRGDGAQALQRSTAARLFIDRVLAHRPVYMLGDDGAADVADLVVRLEGIPLAIELAAARMRTMDVAEINQGLQRRFGLLTGGSRRLQARQQTLRGLVDWSYDMLAPGERTVFDRLAAFVGGFDNDAALAVCGADPVAADAVPALVQSLVDKSLVMRETTPDGERLRMLDTLRDYAAEKLQAAPDAPAVAARHREHCFGVSKDGSRGLQGAVQAKWLRRFEADTPRHPPRAAGPPRCRGRGGPGRGLFGRAGWALRHGADAPRQRRSLSGLLIHAGEAIEGGSWPQRRAVVIDVRCWLVCARAGRHAAFNLRGRSPAACGNPSCRNNAWMRGQRPPRAHQPPST